MAMKKYISNLILVVSMLCWLPGWSQSRLTMVRKSDKKEIVLKTDHLVTIYTKDTILTNVVLQSFFDTSLTVYKILGFDSTGVKKELIEVRFCDVKAVKGDLIKRIDGAEGLGFLSLGTAVAVISSPFIALGDDPVEGATVFISGSIAHLACTIPIILMNIKIKRSLDKWVFKAIV